VHQGHQFWPAAGERVRHLRLGPSHRLTSEALPTLGQQVQQVALELSAAFGYSPPRTPQDADQRA
jgi:hypothetical protein